MHRAFLVAASFAAAIGLLPAGSSAQTLDDIISMNLDAKGGLTRIKATSSVRMTGRVTATDPETGQAMTAAITTLASRPNRMRREQFAGGEVTVSAFDGTTLWTSRGSGPAREAPGPQAAYARQDAEFDSVFVDFREKGHAISLVGRDRRDGADVFHLKVTKKGGPPQDYYLDAATGLERAVSVTLQGPAGPVTIATEFGDYRKQDGRMLPFSIRQRVNGAVTASTVIETVEFNVPVEASAFTMPRGK